MPYGTVWVDEPSPFVVAGVAMYNRAGCPRYPAAGRGWARDISRKVFLTNRDGDRKNVPPIVSQKICLWGRDLKLISIRSVRADINYGLFSKEMILPKQQAWVYDFTHSVPASLSICKFFSYHPQK